MAHFAKLNENNIVETVLVVDNHVLLNENQIEDENLGIQYLKSLFGQDTNWIQTSYNHSFRTRMGSPGYIYDSNLDIFLHQKPYPSWYYDDTIKDWAPPTPYPFDGDSYTWDENNLNWIKV